MPNEVMRDEAVLEMQIDNRQFIKGAEKTITVVDKLKNALSFKGHDDGFDRIQKSANNVDLTGIAKDLEAITKRFTTLGQTGMNVIKNLTDDIYNFSKKTVKSLTIEPVTQGMSKYESYIKATQTIMAATRNETVPEQYASQLEYVEDMLSKLMWYSDETSASFTDMIETVGKFTSSGVGLEDAVREAMGVYNAAFGAGVSNQQAGMALYNLAQALSTGKVTQVDWKSIENANMATEEFKNVILEAAVQIGTLKKDASGAFKTLKGETITATKGFKSFMEQGLFTRNVLEQALINMGEYSYTLNAAIEDLGISSNYSTSEIMDMFEAVNKSADKSKALQELHDRLYDELEGKGVPTVKALTEVYEKLSDQTYAISENAFKMGQEYKTFADVLEATKDAVSSGWMTTFRHIFGNLEEAKQLWTDVGGVFYELFAQGAELRNNILEIWHTTGGRDSLISAIRNLYNAVKSFVDPIVNAFKKVFTVFNENNESETAKKLTDLTKRFEKWTEKLTLSEKTITGIGNAFEKFFGFLPKAIKWVSALFKKWVPGYEQLNKVLPKTLGYLKDFVVLFFDAFSDGEKGFDWEFFKTGAVAIFNNISESILKLWAAVKKYADEVKDIPILGTVFDKLVTVVETLRGLFTKSTEEASEMEEGTGFLDKALDRLSSFWTSFTGAVDDVNDGLGTLWSWVKSIGDIATEAWDALSGDDPSSVGSKVTAFVTGILNGIRDGLKTIKLSDIIDSAKTGIFLYIAYEFSKFIKTIKGTAKEFNTVWESFGGVFRSMSSAISSYGKSQNANYMLKIAGAVAILAASMIALSLVPERKIVTVAVSLAFLFKILQGIAKGMAKWGKFGGDKINTNNSGNTTLSNSMFSGNTTTFNVFSSIAQNLIAMAILIVAAAHVIKQLGVLNTDQIYTGLTVIGIIMAEAVATLVFLSKNAENLRPGTMLPLLGMAALIWSVGTALEKVENIDWKKIATTGAVIAGVIVAMGFAVKLMQQSSWSSGLGSMLSLFSIVAAMYAIVPLMLGIDAYMAKNGGERLISDFFVLAIAGGILVGFAAIMAKIGNAKGALKGAAQLAIIGAAMILFAAALTIAVPSILIFVNGLFDLLAKMVEFGDFGGLAIAIIMLAGLAVVLGLLGYAAGFIGKAMLSAGIGFVTFAAGLLLVSVALGILATVLVPFGGAIVDFCEMLLSNGETIVKIVALTIAGVLAAIAASKLHIAYTLISVILTILIVIHEFGPQIINVLYIIAEDIFKFLFELIPLFVAFLLAAILTIINNLANAIRANASAILDAIENLVAAIFTLLIEGLIRLFGKLGAFLTEAFYTVFRPGEKVDGALLEWSKKMDDIADQVDKDINDAFGPPIDTAGKSGEDMFKSFIGNFEGKADSLESLDEFGTAIKNRLNPVAEDVGSEGGGVTAQAYMDNITSYLGESVPGLNVDLSSISSAFDISGQTGPLGNNAATSFISNIYGTGSDNHVQGAYDAGFAVSNAGIQGMADGQQSHSPSRLAMQLGAYLIQGYVSGISDNENRAYTATESLAIKMGESMRNALTTVQALAEQDFEMHPRITPVVDMSNIDSAAGSMNSMFGNASARLSGVGRNMANLDSAASSMSALSNAKSNISQDTYEVNIYTQPGMDEEMIADAVIVRLSNGLVRKEVSLG